MKIQRQKVIFSIKQTFAEISKLLVVFENNFRMFIALSIFGILVNLPGYIEQSCYNMDSIFYEKNYQYYSGQWEIQNGRIGLLYVDQFKNGISAIILISIFSIFILSLSTIVLLDIYKLKNKYLTLLTFGILMVCPALISLITYSYCIDGYIFSIFLITIGSWIFINLTNKLFSFMFTTILYALSMTLYQNNIGVALIILCTSLLISIISNDSLQDKKKPIFEYMSYLILGFSSILTYYAISTYALWSYNLPWAEYEGISRPSLFQIIVNLPSSTRNIIKEIVRFYIKNDYMYNSTYKIPSSFLCLFIICISLLIYVFFRRKIYKNIEYCISILLIAISLLIGTFFIKLLTPSLSLGIRMSFGMTYFLISLFIISLKCLDLKNMFSKITINFIKIIIASLCIVFLRAYSLIANATYINLKKQDDVAYVMAANIYDDVRTRYDISDNGMKVAIIGSLTKNYWYNSKCGLEDDGIRDPLVMDHENQFWMSNRTWDSYYTRRFGLPALFTVTNDKYETIIHSNDFKNMKIYPSNESIKIIDEIIVVKIS
jgi:hypothetical protein